MNELIAVLLLAVVIDRVLGEPPSAVHSTVWMGKLIDYLKGRAFGNKKLYGLFIFAGVTLPFSIGVYAIMKLAGGVWAVILGGVILKMQFSWRAMGQHASPIVKLLESGDIDGARGEVSKIVGRKTEKLDEPHIISAAVESIGESCVDGVISPLFYFLVFSPLGMPLAVAAATFYRAVNTLDSMIGYKEVEIGTFSARVDDILNFLPSRLTAFLFIVASFLAGSCRNAVRIYLRDRKKTPSPNSGQPMAALAGALHIQLEKIGFYTLGDRGEDLNSRHILKALKFVDLSILIFLTTILGVIGFVGLAR
jgi:adenosylcobinamide-phosphate synthase